MKVGLLLLGGNPIETIECAIEHDFNIVEVALENWVDILTRSQMEEAHDLCVRHGVTLAAHAPSSDLHLGSSNNGIRNESIRQIQKAIQLLDGFADYMTIHTGYIPRFKHIGTLERVIDAIRTLLETTREHSMRLCIENVHENSIDQLLDYIRLVNHDHIKITIDLAHVKLYANYSAFAAIRVLSPYIYNIHLSDTDGNNDLHLPLGAGCLDVKGAITALTQEKYHHGCVIEAFTIEDAIRSRNFLKGLTEVEDPTL